jgi:putative copper export protein
MGDAVNPWLHIVAATVWVGPQIFLFLAAVPAVRTIEDLHLRTQVMRTLTRRFGYLAGSALLVLVITGIGNMYEHDRDIDELFDLNWGIIFQVKMTLLIATVLLTAVHAFIVGPRLLEMQESVTDEAQIASTRRLSIIISAVNLLMALAILFCAALLNTNWAYE